MLENPRLVSGLGRSSASVEEFIERWLLASAGEKTAGTADSLSGELHSGPRPSGGVLVDEARVELEAGVVVSERRLRLLGLLLGLSEVHEPAEGTQVR